MRGLYDCLSACVPYFVESGQARSGSRASVGGDVQRYAQTCVGARQLFWIDDVFADYHEIMPYRVDRSESD